MENREIANSQPFEGTFNLLLSVTSIEEARLDTLTAFQFRLLAYNFSGWHF